MSRMPPGPSVAQASGELIRFLHPPGTVRSGCIFGNTLIRKGGGTPLFGWMGNTRTDTDSLMLSGKLA